MFCIKLYRIQWSGRSDSASVRGMNKKLNSTITPVLKVQRDPRNKSVPITSPFFNPLEPYHTDFPLSFDALSNYISCTIFNARSYPLNRSQSTAPFAIRMADVVRLRCQLLEITSNGCPWIKRNAESKSSQESQRTWSKQSLPTRWFFSFLLGLHVYLRVHL